MSTYEELTKSQSQLQLELIQFRQNLSTKLTIAFAEKKESQALINRYNDEFQTNHLKLLQLVKLEPLTGSRSYFALRHDENFKSEFIKAGEVLGHLQVFDEEMTIAQLHREMKRMSEEIKDLKQNNGQAPVVLIQNLMEEMKASRVPLRFPEFPKTEVYKRYREWRSAVFNFEKTNAVADSVKIQHLKDACKGTEGDQIVSLFSIDADSFSAAIESLDNRFLVSRIIIMEHLGAVIQISPQSARGGQTRHLKEVIDTFSAMTKNVESVCRESLAAKGICNPEPDVLSKAIINAIYMGLLFRTLDDNMKTNLSSSMNLKAMELPEFKDVLSSLEKRLMATQSGEQGRSSHHFVAAVSHGKSVGFKGCILCPGNSHGTSNCRKLSVSGMSFQDKISLLKNSSSKVKLCWICLEKPMETCDCKKRNRVCGGCGGSHHRILCSKKKFDQNPNGFSKGGKPQNALAPKASVATVVASVSSVLKTAVLGTILLKVKSRSGDFINMRCMVDDGSMISYITTEAFQTLGCKSTKTYKEVRTVNGNQLDPIEKETILEFQDVKESFPSPFVIGEVAIARKVPLVLPSKHIKLNISQEMRKGIRFADPQFEIPNGVDILIGTIPWALMKLEGSILIGETRLQNTMFGYVVQGSVAVDSQMNNAIVATIVSGEAIAKIREDFKKVFEYEPLVEEEDEFSEHLFKECHTRLPSGQYMVPLIWGTERNLGDSYNVCFKRNERVLAKLKPDEIQKVIKVLEDYRDADIINLCSDERQGGYYAPFVLVWRNTVTTPLRICLDASQKSTNGLSANDIQLVGMKLQPDLVEQLLRFRHHPIAIISDISQMYLNILIRPEDRKFQRSILNLPGKCVQEIEYNTVLFGATCAPYLAQRTIQQLAMDEQQNFPLASNVLKTCCYIDDIIFSSEDLQSAQATISELLKATLSAKFVLHKIASNDTQALSNVPLTSQMSSVSTADSSSVLGVQWRFKGADELFVKMPSKSIGKLTKRIALSILASIYDPLGLLTPALMPARFIIQEIWVRDRHLKSVELAHTWDTELSMDLSELYHQWYTDLTSASPISFPRFSDFDKKSNQSICAFTDASKRGYGAVVYLRTENSSGEFDFQLLLSKGKVAPVVHEASEKIAALTIPRLELMGALVGAELVQKVRRSWGLDKNFPVYMFTDSEIVLAQISRSTIRDVFSENRLRKIRKLVDKKCWFYVPTGDNPADLITRGISMRDMEGFWKTGPSTMRSATFEPCNKFQIDDEVSPIVNTMSVEESNCELPFSFLTKYRSFRKTIRIMAYLQKGKLAFQGGKPEVTITSDEMLSNKSRVIKIFQSVYYSQEIELLKSKISISNGSLRTKNAFLDLEGILRIGTRIQLEEIDYDERNPVVLPPISSQLNKSNHISYQVIKDAHLDNLHGGLTSTMADIKQRFFIPGLRNGIRRQIAQCQLCAVVRAKAQTQMMGNLPSQIVLKNPAFWHVSLDYCGPIMLKTRARKPRGEDLRDEVNRTLYDKAWILLIACFTTGAYHLEIVPDLKATSFVRAFENFVSTRGLPYSVRSDNASTFHRAKDMLKEVCKAYQDSIVNGEEAIQNWAIAKNIRWSFNPPLASHFGGKHERAIRSLRDKLRKSIGLSKLSFVDYHATLKRIEGILNSRPMITARGVFEEGDFILTPGHFIIGRPITMFPGTDFPTKDMSLREAYKVRMNIENHFWKVFHKSHIQEIANRTRWCQRRENIKVGDLVLLYEDHTPSLSWRKGVVTKVRIGKDGGVRVVILSTMYGEFERPVAKVILIPGGIEIVDERESEISQSGETPNVVINSNEAITDEVIVETLDGVSGANGNHDKIDDNLVKKTDVQPPRRSKRVAARKTKFKLGLLVGALLCLMCASSDAQKQGLRVNASHGGGAMIYEKDNLLLDEGLFHILINTDSKADADAHEILWLYNRFWKICDHTVNSLGEKWKCGAVLFEVRDKCKRAVAKMEEVSGTNLSSIWDYYNSAFRQKVLSHESFRKRNRREIREKRSKGWFWRMIEWAFDFGTNDSDDGILHDRSAGLIVQTVNGVRKIEKQIVEHENLLQLEMNRLNRELEFQKRQGAYKDMNAMESQFHRTGSVIKAYVDRVMEPYSDYPLSDIEILEFITTINLKVLQKGARIPAMHLFHLRKLLEIEILYDRFVIVTVAFPLVRIDHFQRVIVVPFPDLETNSMTNFSVTEVIINTMTQQYVRLEDATFVAINHSMSIMKAQIIKKISIDTSCPIRLAALPNQECGVVPLEKGYELWFITPLHNVIQYYSEKKKVLVCPNNRTEILSSFGVLLIPPQCFVESGFTIIRSTLDEVKTERRMAKVTYENMDSLFNKSVVLSKNFTRTVPDNFPKFDVTDTKLDAVITEADAIETSDFWKVVSIIINVTIVASFVLTGLIYCFCIKTKIPVGIDINMKSNDLEFTEDVGLKINDAKAESSTVKDVPHASPIFGVKQI